MFEFIDRDPSQDAATLSPAEQDQVVDECFNCKLCGELNCPYTPGKHEWEIDLPRLVLRAKAVGKKTNKGGPRERLTDQVLGRTDLIGKVNTFAPRSPTRRWAPRTRCRASSWRRPSASPPTASCRRTPRSASPPGFKRRARLRFERRQGKVALFSIDHANYAFDVELPEATIGELRSDLLGT